MTEQQTAGGLDFEALRRAIEQSDADSLTSFYAEEAEMLTVNRNSTPSSPQVLRGKEAIAEYLADVCGRDMTHRIENEVVGQDRIAFNEACEYPDGLRVLAAATLDVRDGHIVRQVNVEAWDEQAEAQLPQLAHQARGGEAFPIISHYLLIPTSLRP